MPITVGQPSPSQLIKNFDALITQSIEQSETAIVDAIGIELPLMNMIMKGNEYKPAKGILIKIPLMYQLADFDSYSGYDELSVSPTDGITAAMFEWRQVASPITYSMEEILKNADGLIDLADTKIEQTKVGITEGWAKAFMRGNGSGATRSPKVSGVNQSLNIEPLGKLVDFTPTTSTEVGGINQSTSAWWRNKSVTSAATTYEGYLREMDRMYDQISSDTGGAPTLIPMDLENYGNFKFAFFQKYRQTSSDPTFNFEHVMFRKARVVPDALVIDAFSDNIATTTWGTTYMLTMKNWRTRYFQGRNFKMLLNEDGKAFQKPHNGDSRVGHLAWMGNNCPNNRRKMGVIGKLAKNLT
jgi:hypothetical protein